MQDKPAGKALADIHEIDNIMIGGISMATIKITKHNFKDEVLDSKEPLRGLNATLPPVPMAILAIIASLLSIQGRANTSHSGR